MGRTAAQLAPQDRHWLTMAEAMDYARIKSRNTMKKYLRAGDFYGEAINERGDWRIDKNSIDAHLERTRLKALAIMGKFRR